MDHPGAEILGRFALDRSLVPKPDLVERHLVECADCLAQLHRIQAFDAVIADRDAWIGLEEEPPPSREQLRAFAEQVTTEDRDAKQLLSEFDDAPAARLVWANLASKSGYRTGGVVRLLNRRANAMCDREPRYALVLAETATEIGKLLPEDEYPSAPIHEWRGEAWKEQANALFSLGRFSDALAALERAKSEYDKLPHTGIGHVAVSYVRALVLYEQEDFDAAERDSEIAARAALHLGASDRYMAARTLRGNIAFRRGLYRRAAEIFEEALEYGRSLKSAVWIARESLNLGLCHLELGHLKSARPNLETALTQFSNLRFDAEVIRTKWALARLAFAEGLANEGIRELYRAVEDLNRAEMLTDAAVASVHLAEMLTSLGRTREVAKVLDGVVRTFTRAGKLTGALAALASVKSAAASGKLNPNVAAHVRTYLRRVERRPELPFDPVLV